MATRERAQSWLKDKWTKDDECPLCGVHNWAIGDLVDIPIRDNVLTPSNRVYALVPIHCTNCAYTIFINAIVAKIIARRGQQ
jgi:predicted nucleic-acid-binding Zn-ribbon protein